MCVPFCCLVAIGALIAWVSCESVAWFLLDGRLRGWFVVLLTSAGCWAVFLLALLLVFVGFVICSMAGWLFSWLGTRSFLVSSLV